jgi:hypothetical protein
MEHTDYDIKQIELGNQWLDKWLNDEPAFKDFFIKSRPLRFCLCEVYRILVKLEQLPVYWRNKESELIADCIRMAREWNPEADEQTIESMSKGIAVLVVLSEKRLKVTTGG